MNKTFQDPICFIPPQCKSCEDPNLVFVFGSNEAGIHGAGAALHARKYHGAMPGRGFGMPDDAKSFAIPTKNRMIKTLPLEAIREYVKEFIFIAMTLPHIKFNLTRIGCGLAGYTDSDIAPMFKDAPINVIKPEGW